MEKASLHGLAFQTDVHVDVDVVKAHIDDSYSDFVCGIYARFSSPYFRPIGEPPKEQSDGTHAIVNETIDVSVFDRWRSDREYRPNNLVDWARGHGIDIATLNNSVRASPQSSNIFPPPELFPTPGLFPPPALLPPPGQGFAPPTTFIKGSWWITYLFDQTLWVDPMDQTRSWGVFGNVGISDGRPNPIHWSAIFGIGGSSPIPNRKLDTFGIAYYYLGFSDSFKNLAPPFLRDERGLELFYNVAVTPWFHVTADLQVITPLLQPVHTSLVLGLRSKIIF